MKLANLAFTDYADNLTRMCPVDLIDEELNKNVGTHALSSTVTKVDILASDLLM